MRAPCDRHTRLSALLTAPDTPRIEENKTFQETIVDLSKSVAAYLGINKDAYNYDQFEGDLRGHGRAIIKKIFVDLFGQELLSNMSPEARKFLGLEILDELEPNTELDV